MKLNIFKTIMTLFLSLITSFYLAHYVDESKKMYFFFGSFFSILVVLIGLIALSFEQNKITINTKVTSGLFLVFILFSQIFFSVYDSFIMPSYIFVTGSITIIYLITIYTISKTKV